MNESLSRFTKHRLGKYALMLIIGFVGWKAFRWVARDHWSRSGIVELVSGRTLSVEQEGLHGTTFKSSHIAVELVKVGRSKP